MYLYNLLQVPGDASSEEIKKAYKREALKAHSDKGGSDELFIELKMPAISSETYLYDRFMMLTASKV